jgi:hypothetical protein
MLQVGTLLPVALGATGGISVCFAKATDVVDIICQSMEFVIVEVTNSFLSNWTTRMKCTLGLVDAT